MSIIFLNRNWSICYVKCGLYLKMAWLRNYQFACHAIKIDKRILTWVWSERTFQHGGRMCRLSKHGNYTWTTDELRPFRVYPCQRWRKFHLLNATLAWMQCGMSQNEVLMPNYDASNGEQATRCHNVAVRGRKFSIPAQGRSKTLQLNIKMMNFSKTSRRKRSSRGRTERYNSGPNRGTGERSCVKGNTTQENGPQNSCVRDILL